MTTAQPGQFSAEFDIRCVGCGKTPDELDEYIRAAKLEETTPTEFVRREEGTFNRTNGHFACTDCYIRFGMPTRPGGGWKAP